MPQLALFPSAQAKQSDDFTVTTQDELKIGSFAYASTKVCVEPKNAPKGGTYKASIGLLGGWFASKQFTIKVDDPPVAHTNEVIGKAISTALPLRVPLTSGDIVHTYELSIADKTSICKVEAHELVCEVVDLGLTPGKEYPLELSRSFKGQHETTVVEGDVTTLQPVTLKKGSITKGKTIYDMPKAFSFTFNKQLTSGEVMLEQKTGKDRTEVPIETSVKDATLTISLSEDLARKAEFVLTVKQAIATNGSALELPIELPFTTSGGPKPKSVSVGSTGVPLSADIVVKLDQPIKKGVDISKYAHIKGVSGSVSQRSATELVYSISGGRCVAFSLVLDKGIASGSNTEVSEAWKFDARTICGTSSVIGYSKQGRPIIAYYFGNGTKTILFTGGMHGSEPSGYTTMQAWVNYLMSYGYKIPADKRVVIVPNTNPDGIAAGTRNSSTNVNIGRNFPTANWKANIETSSGVLKNGGGKSAGSEPETKALLALTRQLNPRLEVSFHAQGSLVGANKFADSVAIGNIYAGLVGYQTMFYNAEAVMGYPMTGEYEDWIGEELGKPAILIELPTHSGNYFYSQLNALLRMLSV